MMNYIQPLRLDYLFQNVLSGSPNIFFVIFLLGFSILAGTFKMNGATYLILSGLASILLYSWFDGGPFILLLFVGGLIIFRIISRVVK